MSQVKGVVLAGGLGTRFLPLTKVVNKHLLDIFDEPMIHYPIRTLAKAGVKDVVLVTGKEIGAFVSLLGDGSQFGIQLQYAQQPEEGGIADALRYAAEATRGHPIAVILGDNIVQEDLKPYLDSFLKQGGGARLLLKPVALEDASRFGIATINDDRIVQIEEKPSSPSSNLAVTGFYMYDDRVFDVIETLRPSARGEYEITDVNKQYVQWNQLHFDVLKGWWTDAGTPASKLKASVLVALNKGVTFHA